MKKLNSAVDNLISPVPNFDFNNASNSIFFEEFSITFFEHYGYVNNPLPVLWIVSIYCYTLDAKSWHYFLKIIQQNKEKKNDKKRG